MDLAGVQGHPPVADAIEPVDDLKSLEGGPILEDAIQERAEFGDVPLPGAQFVDVLSDRLLGGDLELLAEWPVGDQDSEAGVEDEHGLPDEIDDLLGVEMRRPTFPIRVPHVDTPLDLIR